MDLWREAMKDAKNKLKMLFEASDENGNGVMEMDEFMQMIESLKTDVSEREVRPYSKFNRLHLIIMPGSQNVPRS